MNERMDNNLRQSTELVWITTDVVFHRDVLCIAVPVATPDRPPSRSGHVARETQLALDLSDNGREDAC